MGTSSFWLFAALAAVVSYLLGGLNGSILLSNLIYHQDIRTLGSGNPGFTNYKRSFGGVSAWIVMVIDIAKTLVPVLLFRYLFGTYCSAPQFGAAFAGLFAMLGHAYPLWYGFRGGKTFVAGATAIWFVDWRIGLVAAALFLTLLFTVHIMSLASVSAALLCAVLIPFSDFESAAVPVIVALASALLIWRHKSNLIRLAHGEEKKFYLF